MTKKEEALAFLKQHNTGVLATISPSGPHASLVFYTADDAFALYFLTHAGSRKGEALAADSRVAFTVAAQDVPQTLQIEGSAVRVPDEEKSEGPIAELTQALLSNKHYTAPVTKLDTDTVALYRITPTWIRWGDFAFAKDGSANVFTELSAHDTPAA